MRNALSRFEQAVERLIEGSSFRFFRGELQPVEIAKRLEREMDARRLIVPGGSVVPNQYTVHLATADFERLAFRRRTIERELAGHVGRTAARRGLRLDAGVSVVLQPDSTIPRHQMAVDTEFSEAPPQNLTAAPPPEETSRLQIPPAGRPRLGAALVDLAGGRTFAVQQLPFSLGRGADNDAAIPDRRVSRHHARLDSGADGVYLVDLGSTNGTYINGRQVQQRRLGAGDLISLGGYELQFRPDAGHRP